MNSLFKGTAFPSRKIGGIVHIKYGKGLPDEKRNGIGSTPVYGSNGIVGHHSESITLSPVIIIGRKGSVGAVHFSESKCWPIDTSFYVDMFPSEVDPKWLYHCLRCVDFTGYAQGPKPGINRELLYQTTIPVPPLDEQHRIVSRIEELTGRADEVRRLGREKEAELDAALKATYHRIVKNAKQKPLKNVASLIRRKIDTRSDEEYEEMGIRSFGKGTFKKPVLSGQQIGDKRIYRIHEGGLVFNNVFAWEAAIAVAQPGDHDRVGSHRFITYVPHEGEATSEFLCHHFLSGRGLEDIGAASPGSAGRNRTLGLAKLDNIKVPVPEYREQVRFEELAKRRRQIQRESSVIEQELTAFQAAVIAKAFRGEL